MMPERTLLIIGLCALCTFFERLLPFLFFRKKEMSPTVRFLGKMLPSAVMTALVVYCLRDMSFTSVGGYLPKLIAVGVTATLHIWKKNSLISILGGTACYMLLIQVVFA